MKLITMHNHLNVKLREKGFKLHADLNRGKPFGRVVYVDSDTDTWRL